MQIDEKVKEFCIKEYSSLTNNQQKLPTDPDQIELLKQQAPNRKLQSQQINTNNGRWNKDEHIRFVEGLSMYGKNWKLVEEHVGTRSGAQIRSHAQKFFNRLEREFQKKQGNYSSNKQQFQYLQSEKNSQSDYQQQSDQIEQQLISQNIKNIQNPQQTQVRRQRFESFDSTASYDLPSEQIDENKLSTETMKQILPPQQNSKKSILEWIQHYQQEEQKIIKEQLQNPEHIQKQSIESLQKIKGIIQLLYAYQNIQEAQQDQNKKNTNRKSSFNPQNTSQNQNLQKSKFSPNQQDINPEKNKKSDKQMPYYQQFSQKPLVIERKNSIEYQLLQESEKEKEKQKISQSEGISERKKMTEADKETFNQNMFNNYEMQHQSEENSNTTLSQQPKIAHDESFFHYIFSKYGYYFNNNENVPIQNQTIRLSQLVDMGSENYSLNQNQQNNNTNDPPKKRKGSFALVKKDDNDNSAQEKLKKLIKPNPQNSTFLTRLGCTQNQNQDQNNNNSQIIKSNNDLEDTNQNSNIIEDNLNGNSETNIPQQQQQIIDNKQEQDLSKPDRKPTM